MSWFANIRERFSKADKTELGKWTLVLVAGLASLGAGVFEQKSKDNRYNAALEKEISKQTKRILGTQTDE